MESPNDPGEFKKKAEHAFFALGKAIIFFIFGVGLIVGIASTNRLGLRIPKFVEIEATVESVEVTSGRLQGWIPKVVFSYEYEGKTYQNNRTFIGSSSFKNKREWLEFTEYVDKMRAKKSKIQAWVDPERPADAVLFRDGFSLQLLWWGVLGVVLCTVGICIFRKDYANSMRKARAS